MDPITQALVDYDAYLQEGGAPLSLGSMAAARRQRVRKLHPSALGPGLCDRAAAYDVMADIGEIEVEPRTPEELLSFRVGHVLQGFVGEALLRHGALLDMEREVGDERFTGRIDLLLDGMALTGSLFEPNWVVDVKAVKSKTLRDQEAFYPSPFHIAQVTQYVELDGGGARPALYVLTRLDLEARLFTWTWSGDDCAVFKWGQGEPHKVLPGLRAEMRRSQEAQLQWLEQGILPPRCGETPEEHSFMCARTDYRARRAYPKCRYFARCWGRPALPYRLGAWNEAAEEASGEDSLW